MMLAAAVLCAALAVLILAATRIRRLVAKPSTGPTAQAVAAAFARQHGLSVEFGRAPTFGDACHLASRPIRIVLSAMTASSSAPAALAVALHEVAHAEQAARQDGWLRARLALAPLGTLASLCVLPAMLVRVDAAALAFAVSAVVGAVALPTERAASARALEWLRQRGADAEALAEATTCLRWAFATYVLAFVTAPLQVVSYLLSGLRSQPEPVLAPRCVAALGTWLRSPWFWAALVLKTLLVAAVVGSQSADPGAALADALRILRAPASW